MRRVVLALPILLCSCATADMQPAGREWSASGYEGFAESIDVLVGPAVVDCGFFDLIGDKPAPAVRRQAFTCVDGAIKSGKAFKYGTQRLPMDSYATEVIARTPDGKLRMIIFDVMIDGEAPQQWNRICEKVSVDPRTLIIEGEGCVEYSTGRLVTK
jgi:hypothetical protein